MIQTRKEKDLQAHIEKLTRTGRPFLPLGPLSSTRGRVLSTGYFNPIKNHSNRKKRFVKNPRFALVFGQNKTLKICQNNVVINTTLFAGILMGSPAGFLHVLAFLFWRNRFPESWWGKGFSLLGLGNGQGRNSVDYP